MSLVILEVIRLDEEPASKAGADERRPL